MIDTPGRYTLEIVATNSGESVSEEISFTVLKTHTFGIFEDLQGFSIGWVDNWPVYNSDERFIVPGGQPGSVKVIRDEREESTRLWVVGSGAADSQYLSPHPDWLNDWSPYTTLAFWLYFEDLGELQESMAVWIKVSDTIVGFDKSDLKAGWNHLEVDLEELMIDDLSNQTSIIQIVVCSAQVYYVDEIKLIQKLD